MTTNTRETLTPTHEDMYRLDMLLSEWSDGRLQFQTLPEAELAFSILARLSKSLTANLRKALAENEALREALEPFAISAEVLEKEASDG